MLPNSKAIRAPDGHWYLGSRLVYAKEYLEGRGNHKQWRRSFAESELRKTLKRVPPLIAIVPLPDGIQVINEWIDGVDLKSWLSTARSRRDRLDVACELVEVMDDLYAKGVIHRDVKPTNIVIARDGSVWLIDLELMIHCDDPDPGENVGTTGFASPEQVDGAPRHDSDFPALSAVLYTLLTGEGWPRTPAQFADEAENKVLPPESRRVIPIDDVLDEDVFHSRLAEAGYGGLVPEVLLGLRRRAGRTPLPTVLSVLRHERARAWRWPRVRRLAAVGGFGVAGLAFAGVVPDLLAADMAARLAAIHVAVANVPPGESPADLPDEPELPTSDPGKRAPAPIRARARAASGVAHNVSEVTRHCGAATPTEAAFRRHGASIYREGAQWYLAFPDDPRRLPVNESETFTVAADFVCSTPKEAK